MEISRLSQLMTFARARSREKKNEWNGPTCCKRLDTWNRGREWI